MKKILFIIQYDSFINTLIPVITKLNKNNFEIEIILLKSKFYKKIGYQMRFCAYLII